MTIYEIQNAQKTPIWKQRIIECRSSGKSVKDWCKEQGLDFTTYYRWERKILANIIPAEEYPIDTVPALPEPKELSGSSNSIVKVELAPDPEMDEQAAVRFSVNGYEITVPASISTSFLSRLLEAIKHAG